MQRDLRLLPLNMLRREAEARAAAPELLARLADGRLQLALRTFALAAGGRGDGLDRRARPSRPRRAGAGAGGLIANARRAAAQASRTATIAFL